MEFRRVLFRDYFLHFLSKARISHHFTRSIPTISCDYRSKICNHHFPPCKWILVSEEYLFLTTWDRSAHFAPQTGRNAPTSAKKLNKRINLFYCVFAKCEDSLVGKECVLT